MSETIVEPAEDAAAPDETWWRRPEVRSIFWLWLALTVIGLCFSWVPAWLLGGSSSDQMHDIKQTITIFTAAAAPVAALVWAVMIYSIAKWRYKGDGPPPDDAPGFNTNVQSVIIWVIGSAALTLFVFIWGLVKIADIPAAGGVAALPADSAIPIEVQVTGQQWAWNFTYPGLGGIQSDQLYLPVDHPANFEVTSNDVTHSFWIVQMGVKVDANPGAVTGAVVYPDAVGTYDIRCAELCGILHAAMQTQAKVVTQQEFDAWAAQMKATAPPPLPTEEGGG
ncbi:MAG: cytochrome c oxidase subunit II [Actinomycetes bacterium]